MKLTRFITSLNKQILFHIRVSKFFYNKFPIGGKFISLLIDRLALLFFGLDLHSFSINVKQLSIAHPSGVLLGGNGIYSEGRVVIMSGVKFGGKSPSSKEYLEKHKIQRVFELGDNVVIGTNSVVLGPVKICDNVIIGAMSLVNKSIDQPGVYVGTPVKKVSDEITEEWVKNIEL